jgi:hypothetical protein
MAKATGTATDYLDLMVHLRDFLTGSVGSPSPYTAVRDTTPAGSPIVYPSPVTQEMIFQGDASNGGSPTRPFYFGIQSYENPGSSIYGWALRGFTGFDAGSPEGSVLFENQPDASFATYIPLQNTSMSYWFWANERRVIMVVKTGTSYQWMYAGLINPFATESEFPYPLAVMGSSWTADFAFSSNSLDFSTGAIPMGDSNEVPGTGLSCLYLRFVDGQWYPIKNGYRTGSNFGVLYKRPMWPLSPISSANYDTDNYPADLSRIFYALFHASSAGATPTAYLVQTPGSPDPITTLWPLCMMMNDPSYQLFGELDGIYWIHSNGGLTAEDEIFDSGVSPEQRYLVFQNVHRTDPWTFMAVKDI